MADCYRAVRCGGDVPASGAFGLAAVGFGGLRRIRAGAVVRRPFCYFERFMAQNAVLGAVIKRNHDCLKWSTEWRKQTLIRFSGLIS